MSTYLEKLAISADEIMRRLREPGAYEPYYTQEKSKELAKEIAQLGKNKPPRLKTYSRVDERQPYWSDLRWKSYGGKLERQRALEEIKAKNLHRKTVALQEAGFPLFKDPDVIKSLHRKAVLGRVPIAQEQFSNELLGKIKGSDFRNYIGKSLPPPPPPVSSTSAFFKKLLGKIR